MKKASFILLLALSFILCTKTFSIAESEWVLYDSKVGDVDGDGIDELIEMRVENPSYGAARNGDAGHLFGEISLFIKDLNHNLLKIIPTSGGYPVELVLADFTGDGIEEIFIITDAGGKYTEIPQLFSYTKGEMELPSFDKSNSYLNHEILEDYKVRITSNKFSLNSVIAFPKDLIELYDEYGVEMEEPYYSDFTMEIVDFEGDGVYEIEEYVHLKLGYSDLVLGRNIIYKLQNGTWIPVDIDIIPFHSITVTLNGKHIPFDVEPEIISGRTMVPMRNIFEAMGASVEWNSKDDTVIAKRGFDIIKLKINGHAEINGKAIRLDVPSKIIGGRTFVPARFVSEALGAKVDWIGEDGWGTVVIETK